LLSIRLFHPNHLLGSNFQVDGRSEMKSIFIFREIRMGT
jgi:hypothetical protein